MDISSELGVLSVGGSAGELAGILTDQIAGALMT
jgi:hypothetical protein